jgi:hypothetical protein
MIFVHKGRVSSSPRPLGLMPRSWPSIPSVVSASSKGVLLSEDVMSNTVYSPVARVRDG